ncbi:GTP 3',8-cyclase MoaA [Acidithiobacillus thiooxidans]|uniref:GTP 3',8-cyclase MoaA n=1 Tax=Acidithiobacillus thiooxidans TaxID=930 RepID=UPI001C064BE6|nr:GTP 3',8-cyclase MoaA [Acidithiobacillus thiooxidans]MBU2752119.1 GTP 3',8-cyclase MoaA [Acidithiobacillus thiooxidans]
MQDKPQTLEDSWQRSIRYVRISVTDHCNFRCQYCTPESGAPWFPKPEQLTANEYKRLIRIFVGLGVSHIRFTGGEPLLFPALPALIAEAKAAGVEKRSVSTNGVLLARKGATLLRAGLSKVNISLDSLNKERFSAITRGGDLDAVLEGIEVARQIGVPQIALNVVLHQSSTREDLLRLAEFALVGDLDIRFIELMPLGSAGSTLYQRDFYSAQKAKALIETVFGPLQPEQDSPTDGPASLYRVPGFASRVGFITPWSHNFCAACNRVRVNAAGRLLYCLGQEAGLELREALREDLADRHIAQKIQQGVWHDKPERHYFEDVPDRSAPVFMMRVGG